DDLAAHTVARLRGGRLAERARVVAVLDVRGVQDSGDVIDRDRAADAPVVPERTVALSNKAPGVVRPPSIARCDVAVGRAVVRVDGRGAAGDRADHLSGHTGTCDGRDGLVGRLTVVSILHVEAAPTGAA